MTEMEEIKKDASAAEADVKGAPKAMSADEVLEKFDPESGKRKLTGVWDKIVSAICILFALFQLYTATFGVLDAMLQRAIHLCFGLVLIFLLYPASKKWDKTKMNPLDVIFSIIGAAVTLYIVVEYQQLVLRAGMNTQTDFISSLIGSVLVIEAARRTVGWPMIIVALAFLVYAFLGPYAPGILANRGVGM